MVIYGEYLFIENMVTGALIVLYTGKIINQQLSFRRILLCSICCGCYAFILFTNIAGLLSIVGKFLFSMAMTVLAFGKTSPGRLLQNTMVFLGVTVLYGGIAIAVLTSFGWTGVTAASGVYLPPMSYITITAVAACSAWLLWVLIEIVRVKRMESRVVVDAAVTVCRKKWMLRGLIDSGNTLREPLTGNHVCIVRKNLMDELLRHVETPELRYTVIPYHSVGVEKGMLHGYRMDELAVGTKILKSPILAVCEESHFFGNAQDLQILLPGVMLERGIHGNDSTD